MDEFLNGRVNYKGAQTPPLKKALEPEHKRMIIGDTFIRCKDIVMEKVLRF